MLIGKVGRWVRIKITPDVAAVADRISETKALRKDVVYQQAMRVGLDAMDEPFFLKEKK